MAGLPPDPPHPSPSDLPSATQLAVKLAFPVPISEVNRSGEGTPAAPAQPPLEKSRVKEDTHCPSSAAARFIDSAVEKPAQGQPCRPGQDRTARRAEHCDRTAARKRSWEGSVWPHPGLLSGRVCARVQDVMPLCPQGPIMPCGRGRGPGHMLAGPQRHCQGQTRQSRQPPAQRCPLPWG